MKPSQGNNAAEAGKQLMLEPGKYRIDFVREVMIPGESSEPMRDAATECLAPTDPAQLEAILLPGLGDCTGREVHIADGDVSAKMQCRFDEAPGSDLGFEVRGTYDEDSADLTGDATLPEGTLRETRTFTRLGDC
jgi:hypothetical protein